MQDDQTLQTMVIDELAWVPNVDAAHISVAAHDGVVTLSGIVGTLAEKLGAERAAQRVKGVRGIAQEIVVHPPTAHKHGDEEIAERAPHILRWDVAVPHEQIRVKVEKGVVTLTDFVTCQFQRQAAERDVRQLGGVTHIVNQIDVRLASGQGTDPEVVHQKIENALQRSAELEALHIAVTVNGHKVTLRGRVKSWWECRTAESAAWSAPSVTEVDNQLTIGG
jgi:osmotically-inducible protein OsmY